MLNVNESMCSCFSAYNFVIALPLSLYLAYHYFVPHGEYQPYVYSSLLFSHATQTCCSEAEEDLGFFDEVFKASDYPRLIACRVMESSAAIFYQKCSILSFVRQYSCNKYYILRH
jgi:hypothetical protein